MFHSGTLRLSTVSSNGYVVEFDSVPDKRLRSTATAAPLRVPRQVPGHAHLYTMFQSPFGRGYTYINSTTCATNECASRPKCGRVGNHFVILPRTTTKSVPSLLFIFNS